MGGARAVMLKLLQGNPFAVRQKGAILAAQGAIVRPGRQGGSSWQTVVGCRSYSGCTGRVGSVPASVALRGGGEVC